MRISAVIVKKIFSLACNWSKHVTWPNIPCLKPENIWEYSPIFKTKHDVKRIWRMIKTKASIWGENVLGYLPLELICSLKLTVFLKLCSQKTVHFSEQIMSTDKYPTKFSPQIMEAFVFVYLHSINDYPVLFIFNKLMPINSILSIYNCYFLICNLYWTYCNQLCQ